MHRKLKLKAYPKKIRQEGILPAACSNEALLIFELMAPTLHNKSPVTLSFLPTVVRDCKKPLGSRYL